MSSIETELRALRAEAQELDSRMDKIFRNMQKIVDESERGANVAHNAPKILDDLDREFECKTELNGTDVTFLFLATAIQCARQYILSGIKHLASIVRDSKNNMPYWDRLYGNKDWRDILVSPLPYNALLGADGLSHKIKPLGLDPVIGWIFGPVNILTSTITAYNMPNTMSVELPVKDFGLLVPKSRVVRNGIIMESVSTPDIFCSAISRAKSDIMNLFAAVVRYASERGIKYFSNEGLPTPFVDTMSFIRKVDSDLYRSLFETLRTDMSSIIESAAIAAFINAIISFMHSLFYDPTQYTSPKVYAVKTKRIVLLSNVIATSSNIIETAVTKCLSRLDIGGLLVTLKRIVCDINFKQDVKREFITESFNCMIRGKDYDFE